METLGRFLATVLVVSWSHGLPIDQILQSDTSVRHIGLLARLEAEINANKVEIKQLKDTLTGSLQGKAALTSETLSFMAALSNPYGHCATNQPVIFDAVKLNQGGGFDNRTRFIPGTKNRHLPDQFNTFCKALTWRLPCGHSKEFGSQQVGYLFAEPRQTFWQIHSTSIIIRMNAGDDLWIYLVSVAARFTQTIGRTDGSLPFACFLIHDIPRLSLNACTSNL